jgi:hypothetical protein
MTIERGRLADGPAPGAWLMLSFAIVIAGSLIQMRFGDSYVGLQPIYRGAHAWGTDDSYITYRYARNAVDGHGLAFNPGERVEGYSSLLHVALIASGFFVTDDRGIYPLAVGLNVLFACLSVLLFRRIADERLGHRVGGVAALLLAASPPLWVWVASGLETPIVLVFQLLLWLGVERATGGRPYQTILCAAAVLLTLSRADGFVFVAIAVVYLAGRGLSRPALECAVSSGVTLAAHVGWRLAYYGYPLPNTYYAKVSGPWWLRIVEGVKGLLRVGFFHSPSLVLYLTVLSFLIIRALRSLKRRWPPGVEQIPFEIALVPLLLSYWLWVGGDYFGDRFLLILYPAGILAVLTLLERFEPRVRRLALAGIAVLQLAALARSPLFTYRPEKYDYWIELAPYLSARYQDPLLAIDAAGKVPFFTHWRTLDMLGLNDLHIGHKPADTFGAPGHNKYDADYVLAKRPDLIAAWIDRDLNMSYGLKREKYQQASYELRFVMAANLTPPPERVIDVTTLSDDEIRRLFDTGYVYGVLARKGK